MSTTMNWCNVCDEGSLEGYPKMVRCSECCFSFHLHCAIDPDELDGVAEEIDEVDPKHCPKCQGKYIEAADQATVTAWCQAISSANVRHLTRSLFQPIAALPSTHFELNLPSIQRIDVDVLKELSKGEYSLFLGYLEPGLADRSNVITPSYVEQIIDDYQHNGTNPLDFGKYSLASDNSFDILCNDFRVPFLGVVKEEESDKIQKVNAGGLGAKAGLRKGDVITHFNGQSIRSWDDFAPARIACKGEKSITIQVRRQKKVIDLQCDVGSLPYPKIILSLCQLSAPMLMSLFRYPGELELSLNHVSTIDAATAEILVQYPGNISLPGVAEISDEVAQILSGHKMPDSRAYVTLGLTRISDVAAASLGVLKSCFLRLDELVEISFEAARGLAKHRILSLDGLKTISAESAAEFIGKDGQLSLNGLTEIDDDVATNFSQHKGNLYLGLKKIAGSTAKLLAKRNGGFLGLDALTELTPSVAKELCSYTGTLSLGLTEITDELATILSEYSGDLSLDVIRLSDRAAKALAKHKGELFLNGLTELSDDAAEELANHDGILNLDGITKLSPRGVQALKRHGRVDDALDLDAFVGG